MIESLTTGLQLSSSLGLKLDYFVFPLLNVTERSRILQPFSDFSNLPGLSTNRVSARGISNFFYGKFFRPNEPTVSG